jgi:polyhydroxyalkanoate synthesis regulator phasin
VASLAAWALQLLDQLLRNTRASQSLQLATAQTGSAHKVKLQDRWVASVDFPLDEVQRAWIAHKLMASHTIGQLLAMRQHELSDVLVANMSMNRDEATNLAAALQAFAAALQQDARHRFSKRDLQKYTLEYGFNMMEPSELRQLVITLAGDRPYEATDPTGSPLHPVWALMAIEQLF